MQYYLSRSSYSYKWIPHAPINFPKLPGIVSNGYLMLFISTQVHD